MIAINRKQIHSKPSLLPLILSHTPSSRTSAEECCGLAVMQLSGSEIPTVITGITPIGERVMYM